MQIEGWIGVDLDGTLAHYTDWKGENHIGEPIPEMMDRVKNWLACGIKIKIFTARACLPEQIPPIQLWLNKHGIGHLEITNQKDFGMIELWDDRCIRIVTNTGKICCDYIGELTGGEGKV